MPNDLLSGFDEAMTQATTDDKAAGGGVDLYAELDKPTTTVASSGDKPKKAEPVDLYAELGIKAQPRMERTWGEVAGDTAVQVAEGVNTLGEGVVSLVAPDSGAAEFFEGNADYWRDKQSMPMQRRITRAEERIAQADPDSLLDQGAAALDAYSSDGAMVGRLLATNVASMFPGAAAAKAAKVASLARGVSLAGAHSAGTLAAGGVNAAINGGSARGDAYDEIKKSLANSGKSAEEIEELALKGSLLPAAVGGVVGFATGRTGLEDAIAGSGIMKGGVQVAARKAGAELLGEQAEEIAPKVASNYQVSEYDNRPLTRDVGRTSVETAFASGPTAGVAGAIAGLSKEAPAPAPTPTPTPTPTQTPTPAPTQASSQAPAQASTQPAQAPDALPGTPQGVPQGEADPLHMDADKAAQRLAELEIIGASTELNPAQQRERAMLVHRMDELAEIQSDMEAGLITEEQAQAKASKQAPEQESTQTTAHTEAPAQARETIHPDDLPDAGADVGPQGVPFTAAHVRAKTWPQFVTERGYAVEGLRKGTQEWANLQTEWAAVKTHRAGLNEQGNGQAGQPVNEIQNRDRSRPASVIQMQEMARSPDYGRLGISRTPDSGAPMVYAEGDQVHAVQHIGGADVATMSDGQRVPFQYAVMDAGDVQPSNFADGSVNPQFDAAVPGLVKALNNGRTAALRAAYERGTAEQYKQELMADAQAHGIDPAAIAAMKSPVLVRLYSERDNRHNMGVKSQSQSLGLSAAEQAATDAHLMDASMLDMFDSGALDGMGNLDFVRGFMARLQKAGQDVAEMMDAAGRVSPKGVQRLQAALVHKAFDDGDMVETMFGSTDNDIKAIGEALKDVAGEWAHMRHMVATGAIHPEADVTANLLQAIRLIQKSRRDRVALADLVAQTDIETGEAVDAMSVGMLRLLYSGAHLTRALGRDAMVEGLRQYMTAALATTAQGSDMFGEAVGAVEILSALTGIAIPKRNTSNQASTQESTQASAQQSTQGAAQNERREQAEEGSGKPIGSEFAGGRPDESGNEEQGRAADAAGQAVNQPGTSGAGQDAQAQGGQPTGQSSEGDAKDSSRPVTAEPAAAVLQAYTPEEIRAQQDAQEAADKAKQEADAQAAKEEKARKDRADIESRQAASAENFQLGQDPFDSLAGQGSIFDAPAPAPAPAQAPKPEPKQAPAQDSLDVIEGPSQGVIDAENKQKSAQASKEQSAKDSMPSDDELGAMFDDILAQEVESKKEEEPTELTTTTGHKVGDFVRVGRGSVEIRIHGIKPDGTVQVVMPSIGMKNMSAEDFARRVEDAKQVAAEKAQRIEEKTAELVRYRDPETGATWSGRGKPPGWIVGKDRAQFEVQQQREKAPKQESDKPKSKAAQLREAEEQARNEISDKYLGGARVGDTITPSKAFEYIDGGESLVIESIALGRHAEVHVRGATGARTSFSAAVAHARGVKFEVTPAAPTVGKALASAAGNTAAGLSAAIDGLGALFGGAGKLGSGLAFDEETYAKAKPLFAQAVAHLGDAASDVADAMRAVIRMVNDKFGEEATRNMKPYVIQYIKDLKKEKQDAPSSLGSVERDSTKPAAVSGDGGAIQRDAADTAPDDRKTSGQSSAGVRAGQQHDAGVSVGAAVAGGKRGDQPIHRGDGESGATGRVAGADFFEGLPSDSRAGVALEPSPAHTIANIAHQGSPKTARRVDGADAKKPASNSLSKQENSSNLLELGSPEHAEQVRQAVPQLLAGQVEDVVKAEVAFSKPDGFGMLLTNGTGTGKTFSGLGVARRFVDDGKTNILIVVPDDKIGSDWIASGKVVGLSITQLESTKDAGKGVVLTTYANLGANNALTSREWDLVVADEAHSLMSNQQADNTSALINMRALTYHASAAFRRHRMVHAQEYELMQELRDKAKFERGWDNAQRDAVAKELEDQIEAMEGRLQSSLKVMQEEFAERQESGKRSKLLALSATPFAYEKNIEWAEGYLFNYSEGRRDDNREFRGYNEGGNREQFFMQHFGYRMRYNKLTEPEAGVDRGVMQRQFNTWLKQRGVLSTRMLDVPADYDRRFVLFESAIGNRIDEALSYIAEQRQDSAGYALLQEAVDKSLNYQARRYLLEALKAKEAVGMVRAHMAMGRKVVVFHDFIKGGGTNPFAIDVASVTDDDAKRSALRDALRDFDEKFGDLKRANLQDMPSPLTLFKKEFGDALLVVNGQVTPKRNVLQAYKTFNDDAMGPQVMLVQSAKDKGWSGHDTTGKHQRVLINLGLPTAPTKAIQQEGRIYRTGQVSNAIMRYLNTGTSWERIAFASTIATRAATAENLALGELARSLQDSFIEAFEASAPWEPGHEGEGTGGKESDRARNTVVTEWDRAKTLYWAQQKKNSKTKAQEGQDYFATPEPLGLKMVQWAGAVTGESTLEPSAGHGAIARWFADDTRRTMVEPSPVLRSRLALAGFKDTDRIVASSFEELDISNKYDAIAMNPPFGTAGRTAVDHIAKAYRHLREGGRLVALLPVGSADKKLESWLYEKADKADKDGYVPFTKPELHRVADVLLPASTFGRAGTGVMTRIVVIDKLAKGEEPMHAHSTRDLRYAEDANELFEVLESMALPKRAKQVQHERESRQPVQDVEISRTQAGSEEQGQASNKASAKDGKHERTLPRAGRPNVEHFTAKGKRLVGVIFHGSKDEAMAHDPYTLAKDGGWFIRDRHVIEDDAGGSELPQFSRAAPQKSAGTHPPLTVDQAQSVVDKLVRAWKRVAPIVVVQDMSDPLVPKRVRDYDAATKQAGAQGEAAGFLYGGRVYIVAGAHRSLAGVAVTVMHEVLGHYGLRATFGSDFAGILDQIAKARPREMADMAAKYGVNLQEAGRIAYIAEELLAHLAQTNPKLGFVRRAVASVRTWLRKNVPGMEQLHLADDEIINNYIVPARRFVQEGVYRDRFHQVDSRVDPQFLRTSAGAAVAAVSSKVRPLLSLSQQKVRQWLGFESWDQFVYNWQDRFVDLKRIQASIKELGGTVSDLNNAYRGEELFHKRVAKRTHNFMRDELQPLLKGLSKAGINMEEFELFLHARHAPEANAAMAERNPNQKIIDAERDAAKKEVDRLRTELQKAQTNGSSVTGIQKALTNALLAMDRWSDVQPFDGSEGDRVSLSGMSDNEAAAVMASFSPEKLRSLEQFGAQVDAINDKTLNELESYGLMDKDTIDAWRSAYKHYVPLHRDEAHPESKSHPIGQGFSTRGAAAKSRTGSNQKVTHILAHIALQREAALVRGEKNNVGKRLYLLVAQNPDEEIWSLKLPKKKIVDPHTGLVRTVDDRGALNMDSVLAVRIAGKDQFILFNDKNERAMRLAMAMRNLDAMELDRFTRVMGKLTRWFASVNTQYNPIFSIFNFARDIQGAMLQLSTTPLRGMEQEVLKEVMRNGWAIWREMRNQSNGKGKGSSKYAQLLEQFQLDGGTTGYRDLFSDPKEYANAIAKAIQQEGTGGLKKLPGYLFRMLSDFNEALETTTRLAVYKVAQDKGIGRDESASIAKNITVNFNRKGRNMSVVGSYYAFMNAAIQGNVRLLETLRGERGKQVMIGGALLGMATTMWSKALMGGGGADDEWQKIPQFVKERSLIIAVSHKDYIAIPLPLGFHVFPGIGSKAVELATHDNPHESRASHLLDMALMAVNAYNPLGGVDNLTQMFAPTPLDPVAALLENKDWTGREIYKEQTNKLQPQPGHAMAKPSTTGAAIFVTEMMNAATGGNEWRPGAWSPNPDALEYLIGQFTGGVGREIGKAGNTVQALVTGDELAAHKIPLVGRMYGNTRGINGQSESFYSNLQRINVSAAEAKDRFERGESPDAIWQDVPLARLSTPAAQLHKQVKELTKARAQVQKGSAADKAERVKAINEQIERVMYHLNSASYSVAAQQGRAMD